MGNRLRKPLACLLSFAMVMTMCTGFTSAAYAQKGTAGSASAQEQDPTKCTDLGNGLEDDPYLISNAAQLADLATQVNNGSDFNGSFFKVTDDIDASADTYSELCIGNASNKYFKGSFDGDGHTITVDIALPDVEGVGLFGRIAGDTTVIKNLTLAGQVRGGEDTGGIVGAAMYGTITISKCTNKATVYGNAPSDSHKTGIGGIVAKVNSVAATTITGCTNEGSIKPTFTSTTGIGGVNFGGIIGVVFNYSKQVTVSECENKGQITEAPSAGGVGGIVGMVYNAEAKIANCSNSAGVSATGNRTTSQNGVGGIVGYIEAKNSDYSSIERCSNNASVLGRDASGACTGGIAGKVYSGNYTVGTPIDECFNLGKVATDRGAVGGIVGSTLADVSSCYNRGVVGNDASSATSSADASAGGIAGILTNAKTSVTSCYSSGNIKNSASKDYACTGGILGQAFSENVNSAYINKNLYQDGTAALGIGNVSSDSEVAMSFVASSKAKLHKQLGATYQADLATAINDEYPILRWQNADATFNASFAVTDAETEKALTDAVVTIAGETAEDDGSFELTPGSYEYKVTRSGYETVKDMLTIAKKSRSIKVEMGSIKHDYTVKVTPANATLAISNDNEAPAVADPKVTVDKEANTASYVYQLADKDAYGAYKLSVRCYTYTPQELSLEATGSADESTVSMTLAATEDFTLTTSPANAKVYLLNTEYNELATPVSSSDGVWSYKLIPGTYTYRVKAAHYTTQEGSVQVPGQGSLAITLTEQPVWDGSSIDIDWYRWHFSGDDTYEIGEPEELAGLASLVAAGTDFSDKTIKLVNDIDLGGDASTDTNSWSSIGHTASASNLQPFKGTFDGQGHTIKNLYMKMSGSTAAGPNANRGLFGCTEGATIKNLNVADAYLTATVSEDGSVKQAYNCVGTVVGRAQDTRIENVTTSGTLLNASSGNGGAYTGGICGQLRGGAIVDCVNEVSVSADYSAGGIVGNTYSKTGNQVVRCTNRGTVQASRNGIPAYAVGGIVGQLYCTDDSVRQCVNYGTVTGQAQSIGGVVGTGSTSTSYKNQSIVSCYNLGAVSGDTSYNSSYVGGVVGYYATGQTGISKCYNAGTLDGSQYIGGVVGTQSSATINADLVNSNCYLANDSYAGSRTTAGTIDSEAFTSFEKQKDGAYKKLMAVLGDAYCADLKTDSGFVYNDGYPILRWQNPDASYVISFAVSYDDERNLSNSKQVKVQMNDANGESVYTGGVSGCELPDGSYTYTVSREGYEDATGELTVCKDAVSVNVELAVHKYAYSITCEQETELSIVYQGEDGDEAVENPDYTPGSGTETGSYGYQLVCGSYSYTAKRFGYTTQRGSFKIDFADGEAAIELEALKTAAVDFKVSASEGSFTGSDPRVSVYSEDADFKGRLLKTYDASDKILGGEGYQFPRGEYSYKVRAHGYATASGTFKVGADDMSVTCTLAPKGTWTGDVDTDWYTDRATESTFEISSEEELAGLAKLVNDGTESFAGKTVTVTADMDLADNDWTPIGGWSATGALAFRGTFDGGGHSITLKSAPMSASEQTFGLFGYATSATIENVVMQGSTSFTFKQDEDSGSSYSLVYAGGICGYANNSSFLNCSNQMRIKADLSAPSAVINIGGICGWGVGDSFTACNNIAQMKIMMNCTATGIVQAGGICGYANFGMSTIAGSFSSCYNTGDVSATVDAGAEGTAMVTAAGIAGKLAGASGHSSLSSCYSAASIGGVASTSVSTAALVGSSSGTTAFKNNYYLNNGLAETSANSTKMSDEDMRTSDFAAKLGSPYVVNGNGGYPIFNWEAPVERIEVSTMPAKTAYDDLSDFDDAGMKLTAYSGAADTAGTVVNSGWTVVNGTKLAATQTSVTIEYKGATVELPIQVTQVYHQITADDLGFTISAPKTGATPQQKIELTGDQAGKFSAELTWTHAGKSWTGSFEKASYYRAHVKLTSRFEKDDVYYVFQSGAVPTVDGSYEIRCYKEYDPSVSDRTAIEFDVTFKATSNASGIEDKLTHLYYEGERSSGLYYGSQEATESCFSKLLDSTLSFDVCGKKSSLSVRDLEQGALERSTAVQRECASGSYAGVSLYSLLMSAGLDQSTADDAKVVLTGSTSGSESELSFGDLRKQKVDEAALVAFGDATIGAPLGNGTGPLQLVQKEQGAPVRAKLSKVSVEETAPAGTKKLEFKVNESAPSITVTDAFGHEMEASEDGSYLLRDGESYSYRVTKENFTVIKGSVELAGADQVVSITLDPVWDGKTVSEPAKDSSGYYLIGTAAELMWWHGNYDSNDRVKLTADIALNDGESMGNGWEPLGVNSGYGSGTLAFAGTFDGQGHVIRNLSIARENTYELKVAWDGSVMAFADRVSEIGLFGYTTGNATIENLGIEGSIDVFDRPDGSLADWMQVGGIVGLAQGNTKISSCYTNLGIKAVASLETETVGGYPVGGYGYVCDTYMGGIAGSLSATASIENCYSKGSYIAAETRRACVGGIVGALRYDTNSVENCYSTSSIDARTLSTTVWDSYLGGICGFNYNDSAATISGSYALNAQIKGNGVKMTAGKVMGRAAEGALSGNFGLDTMELSGADISWDKGATTINGASITEDAAQKAASYGSWDAGTWTCKDASYPMLAWQVLPAGQDKTASYAGQSTTDDEEWDGYFGSQSAPPYFKIYARVGNSTLLLTTFTRAQMREMAASDNEGVLYYSSISYSGYAGRAVKEYVYVDTLLKEAGIDYASGDALVMGGYRYTLDALLADRYYYPNWTAGSSEDAVKVKPCIALKSHGASSGMSKELFNMYAQQADYLYAYMLTFGQSKPTETTYNYFMHQQVSAGIDFKPSTQASSTLTKYLATQIGDAQSDSDATPVSADGTDVSSSLSYVDQATKDTFTTAIAAARTTLDKKGATNEDAMSAIQDLEKAEKTFDAAKKQGTGVDRGKLESLVLMADKMLANTQVSTDGSDVSEDTNWATQEAASAFESAIANAKEALAYKANTQVEADVAYNDLVEAMQSFAYDVGTLEKLARESAQAALDDYVAQIDRTLYAPAELVQIESLVSEYKAKIAKAKTLDDIDAVLAAGKEAVGEVKTITDLARDEAVATLTAYAQLDKYSGDDLAAMRKILLEYQARIEKLDSQADIDLIVKEAKAALDKQAAAIAEKHRVSISRAKVKLSKKKFAYNTKKRTPKVSVTMSGKKLVAGTDFKVSITKNKKVGKALVSISGIGAYKGTVKTSFTIVPKATSIKSLTGSKKALKVKWAKRKAQTSGYQVSYSLKKSMKGAKVLTVKKASKNSLKIRKLKSGKRYYVKVRTYKTVKKKRFASAWSKAKKAQVR